ncbi:MAG: hypothetical protein ACKN9R_00790 [Candidatus Limnocylindrus sp.]
MKKMLRSRVSQVALLAVVVGGLFGLTRHLLADEEYPCAEILTIEGVGAQDTNGDGNATLTEGALDLNGDGKFGDYEALQLGMNCYICWCSTQNCGAAPVGAAQNNRICLKNARTGVWRCSQPIYSGYYCKLDTSTNKCCGGLGTPP